MAINITIEQAREMWENRANGACERISAGKGGRAWLEGEFRLNELEALCVLIRAEAGPDADGAEEHVAYWAAEDAREASEGGMPPC